MVRVGQYRLLGELGRGGMATVYLAASQGASNFVKLVVVKRLHAELAAELEFREMFMDEARLAARLSHPNIVQTYEVVEGDGKFLLVMEYLEGQPLSNIRSRMIRKQNLSVEDQVLVFRDVLAGLHSAHEARDWDGTPLNVVHRDVSPHNVFVTYEGQVKVVDFGVAKASTSSQRTQTGVIKGKISYMAPEQALGRRVDRRADVFAVGIMLWESLAGRRMWKDLPDAGIVHYLASGEIPKLSEHAPNAPPELARICTKSLSPSPDDRYANADEMRAELAAYLEASPKRPSSVDLGRRVSESFVEERAKIKAVIERQLTQGPMLATAELPAMALPHLPSSDSSASAPALSGNSGFPSMAPLVASPSLTPAAQSRATSLSMSSAAEAPAPPNRNTPLVIAVSCAALGLLTLAGVVVWKSSALAPAAGVGVPAVTAPVAPTTTASVGTTSVTVAVPDTPSSVDAAASVTGATTAPAASPTTGGPKGGKHPVPSSKPVVTAPPATPPGSDIILHR